MRFPVRRCARFRIFCRESSANPRDSGGVRSDATYRHSARCRGSDESTGSLRLEAAGKNRHQNVPIARSGSLSHAFSVRAVPKRGATNPERLVGRIRRVLGDKPCMTRIFPILKNQRCSYRAPIFHPRDFTVFQPPFRLKEFARDVITSAVSCLPPHSSPTRRSPAPRPSSLSPPGVAATPASAPSLTTQTSFLSWRATSASPRPRRSPNAASGLHSICDPRAAKQDPACRRFRM